MLSGGPSGQRRPFPPGLCLVFNYDGNRKKCQFYSSDSLQCFWATLGVSPTSVVGGVIFPKLKFKAVEPQRLTVFGDRTWEEVIN